MQASGLRADFPTVRESAAISVYCSLPSSVNRYSPATLHLDHGGNAFQAVEVTVDIAD